MWHPGNLPSNRRSAFTLFELLIATAVIGLVLACIIPYVVTLRENARRTQCAANLRLIRDGLRTYASDFKSYPRVKYDEASKPEGWTAFTGADDSDPFAANSAVLPNDVTASLWLLVRQGYISDTAAFVCPSSDDFPDRLYDAAGTKTIAKHRGNFRSGHHLSYSMFNPFGSAVRKDVWTDTLPSDCVILADKSPGTADGSDVTRVSADIKTPPEAYAVANSRNHGRAGQNVLRASGFVEFERTPYVGFSYRPAAKDLATDKWAALIPGDNIYTALRPKPIPAGQTPPNDGQGAVGHDVSPAWQYDSYLVPTADD